MIAANVAARIIELRAELGARVDIVADYDDGACMLLITPTDGAPAFTILCDPANLPPVALH